VGACRLLAARVCFSTNPQTNLPSLPASWLNNDRRAADAGDASSLLFKAGQPPMCAKVD